MTTTTASARGATAFAETLAPALGDTVADPDVTLAAVAGPASPSAAGSLRSRTTTVFPRVESDGSTVRLVHEARLRYETERLLGEGGMGTVDLAHDHDIDRPVAVKRLRAEVAGSTGVARFVEEVRTVARLEHPNIVPVHDVGLDEQGYFLVMKYVEGETLEHIIERLDAGDRDAHRRYTFEARVHIFVGLLRALAYAHDRDIVHRDIKPANVMVGPYGEVVLMDWGIARPIDAPELPQGPEPAESAPDDETATKKRMLRTHGSALVGTPMYMSPEQARGQSDLDARSDLYSACVLFHELLTLRHYLADKPSVPAVLVGVMQHELPGPMQVTAHSHPRQPTPPMEYMHFLHRGMSKDRDARWQSAHEMMTVLGEALEGKVRVQCPVTASKRSVREVARFIDRHPVVTTAAVAGTAAGVLLGLAAAVFALVT